MYNIFNNILYYYIAWYYIRITQLLEMKRHTKHEIER